MKYIPETSTEDIIALAHSDNYDDRRHAALYGGKDVLSFLEYDESWLVRETVAFRGYGLDVLVNDPNENVRMRVAENGYGLHELVNDVHYFARAAVAGQGYGLEVLLNDKLHCGTEIEKYLSKHPETKLNFPEPTKSSAELWERAKSDNVNDRITAVEQGGTDILSKLIFDENERVRSAVARRGFGLDILLDDADHRIRLQVAEMGYGDLHKLVNDESFFLRAFVAEQGYGLEVLLNDPQSYTLEAVRSYLSIHPETKLNFPEPKKSSAELWEKAKSGNVNDRITAVEQGGTDILSKLIFDEDVCVREAVARRGFGLDILLDDTDKRVRTVAKQSNNITSESWKDIAKEEIAAVTNNTMKGCLVALENDDMIPANVIYETYELYCQDPMKEQISFEQYLLAKVEPYFDNDKTYYEERLVGYISERLSAIDTRLEKWFNEQLDTKTPLDVLKECGYKNTTIDLGSYIDKDYRLSLMFSEDLDSLVTQQGHTVDKLANPITNSPFIQSVQRNLADIGAGLEKNAAKVAALVAVKGKELLSMLNSVAHKVGDIALSADTTIGLYNDKGKGSSFSISLDKNAVFPSSSLSDFQIEQDGEPAQEQSSRGSITCALNIDLWGKGRLEISQTYHRKPKDRQSRDIERD